MARTYLFYDIESGSSERMRTQILQFAAIRTDESFNPIGEPIMLHGKPMLDFPIAPQAIAVNQVSPLHAASVGLHEPELMTRILAELQKPDTISIAYNGRVFDEEVIRHAAW